ncbi:reverse transcriptase [Caerostris darwini]|uniref:Reverse transcriptase n=1 Tax=Caerostris darwini TaxID=1538125 RepID=A0AAV4MQF3_9ARAC|nr:reverse transcriptase [Caerostris darwini]
MKHAETLNKKALFEVRSSQSEITTKMETAQEVHEHLQLLKTLTDEELKDGYIIKENVLYIQKGSRELIVVLQAIELEVVRGIPSKGHFVV